LPQTQSLPLGPAAAPSQDLVDLEMLRQVPQNARESKQGYARRLFRAFPRLTVSHLSRLSGVHDNNLRQDPTFRELPAELVPIREEHPQREGENNQAYARRLFREQPQHNLTVPQLSHLSGVMEGDLKK
jgi:hypothetical protein